MSAPAAQRPNDDEYPAFYARYLAAVPDGDVIDTLARQGRDTLELLRGLSAEQAGHRYAPGKWSIKEVAGHLADSERVFAYRALRFARGDSQALPGFEEDDYAAEAGSDALPLAMLCDELEIVRAATLSLLRNLKPVAWDRRGSANGHAVSVRAIAWLVAGHERHHLRVLRERYLA